MYKRLIILGVVFIGILLAARIAGDLLIDGQVCFEGATADVNEVCLAFTDPTGDRTWTFGDITDTVVGLVSSQTLTNKVIDGNSNTLSVLSHATDCTAITTGVANQICLELDSENLYTCQPTAGGCDTAGEWILTSGGADGTGYDTVADEGSNLTQRAVVNFTGAGVSCADNAGSSRTDCTIAGGSSGGIDFAKSTIQDDLFCESYQDGRIGTLGWHYIGSPNTLGECTYQPAGTSYSQLRTASGNTWTGFALASYNGTAGQINATAFESDTTFVAYFRLRVQDVSEAIYKIGFGDNNGTDTGDHQSATSDYFGVYFKNETTDTASECFGTTGSGTDFTALFQDSNTTSGLQALGTGLTAATSTLYWVRIKYTSTPGVQVCMDTGTSPTFSTYCYEETTLTRIPPAATPMIGVMTCDGTTTGRIDFDYFYMEFAR